MSEFFSPSQIIPRFQPNISHHCWAQHVARIWPSCCDILGVDVALSCTRLPRFMQQCCARTCALVQFLMFNMQQHVVQILRYDRLARACKFRANNVGIYGVEMLRLLDRGFNVSYVITVKTVSIGRNCKE